MTSELKPCPFCGGEARFDDKHPTYENRMFIGCGECNAEAEPLSRIKCSKDDQIALWNTRATPSADTLKAACHVAATNWPLSGDQVERLFKQVLEIALPEQDTSINKTVIENFNNHISPSADTLEGLRRYNPPSIYERYNPSFGMHEHYEGEYVLYSDAAAVIAVLQRENYDLKFANDDLGKRENFWIGKSKRLAANLDQIKAQEPVAWQWQSSAGDWIDCDEFEAIRKVGIGKHNVRPLYAAPVDQTAEIERLREALCEVHATIEHDRTGKLKSDQNIINAALSGKEP